jgi:hypothetical protein
MKSFLWLGVWRGRVWRGRVCREWGERAREGRERRRCKVGGGGQEGHVRGVGSGLSHKCTTCLEYVRLPGVGGALVVYVEDRGSENENAMHTATRHQMPPRSRAWAGRGQCMPHPHRRGSTTVAAHRSTSSGTCARGVKSCALYLMGVAAAAFDDSCSGFPLPAGVTRLSTAARCTGHTSTPSILYVCSNANSSAPRS